MQWFRVLFICILLVLSTVKLLQNPKRFTSTRKVSLDSQRIMYYAKIHYLYFVKTNENTRVGHGPTKSNAHLFMKRYFTRRHSTRCGRKRGLIETIFNSGNRTLGPQVPKCYQNIFKICGM